MKHGSDELKLTSLISKDFAAIAEDETVESAIEFLKRQKNDFQSKFTYIYVINEKRRLTGILQTRDLLLAESSKEVRTIMKESIVSVFEDASIEEAIELFNAHPYLSVPVVDSKRCLIGVILRGALEAELPGEMKSRLNRLSPHGTEEVEGVSIYAIVLKRLPWLLISVTIGIVCAYILGIFIGKIESIVALILFVPIILGMAGNISTQSARVTTRGLEEGKLSINKLAFILGKEMIVGLIIGFCAFLLIAAVALLWKRYPVEGIALGLSIVVVSFASGLLGVILPITFRTLKIAENKVSGLFLLLICDIVALVLYFLISLSLVSPTMIIT